MVRNIAFLSTGARSRAVATSPLAAQAEVGDQFAVALEIFALQVTEQTPALADLHEQAAAAVVILLVDLQVLGQLVDRGGEDRDLDVGGTGIVRTASVLAGDLGFRFFGEGHALAEAP